MLTKFIRDIETSYSTVVGLRDAIVRCLKGIESEINRCDYKVANITTNFAFAPGNLTKVVYNDHVVIGTIGISVEDIDANTTIATIESVAKPSESVTITATSTNVYIDTDGNIKNYGAITGVKQIRFSFCYAL
ncbi:MAG: hypothetical protein J6T62_06255 [Fibrobacter sp.]|nr:hypothetical protein [Fibrobacter sp.]